MNNASVSYRFSALEIAEIEVPPLESIVDDLIDVYFTIEPFKYTIHEMFMTFIQSTAFNMPDDDKASFICNYHILTGFLSGIELYRLKKEAIENTSDSTFAVPAQA